MMKRIFLMFLVIAVIVPNVESSTATELITKFRAITNEIDTSNSSFTDSTALIWLNFSMQKTVKLGGYVERRNDYVFDRDSSYYALPSTFRNIKGLMLKSQYHAEWQTIFNNPLMATPDTSVMQYTISRVDKDSAEIHLRFGSVGTAYIDIIFIDDSLVYPLPDEFEKMIRIVLISENFYTMPFPNSYFLVDTNVNSYFDFKNENDTSWLYYKPGTGGSTTDEDDTIRVFYERTAIDGDSIRVLYYAGVTDLVSSGSGETELTEDMETFIIDEMIAYYEFYLDDPQAYLNLIQLNRSDMFFEMGGREGAKTSTPNQ